MSQTQPESVELAEALLGLYATSRVSPNAGSVQIIVHIDSVVLRFRGS